MDKAHIAVDFRILRTQKKAKIIEYSPAEFVDFLPLPQPFVYPPKFLPSLEMQTPNEGFLYPISVFVVLLNKWKVKVSFNEPHSSEKITGAPLI